MDSLINYRQLVKNALRKLTEIPYAHGEIHFETIFDSEADRYMLMVLGRRNKKRVHSCLAHIDIIDGKLWIQRDGTEHGIAKELLDAGIPKDHIVLGYRTPEIRKQTGLAVS
ncbi:XisI protein [candidate division KSB1 bacterium]|nr:XisI protein [candidate division KSB1 bacterium]MBL7093830.1 XisI protein [candidate division KSB1 bacterium]